MKKLKIGLFSIGLDTYWDQFKGLLEKLNEFQSTVENKLKTDNTLIVNVGMVDNPVKANAAAKLFKQEDVDVLFLFISTYALSHTALPIAQKVKVPIIILSLQPNKAINYKTFNKIGDKGVMTGEWLSYCQSCVSPEIASVFNRADISYTLISGYLHETAVWDEVNEWLQAIRVQKAMQNNRVGILGNYYNGMLDVYSDLTLQASTFGNHFELIEFGVLKMLRENTAKEEIEQKISQFKNVFSISKECAEEEILRAAKTSVALDKLVEDKKLGSLAYYYEGNGDSDYETIVTSLIPGLTILTGSNVPVAGECEVKNVQAMKIMDLLGSGGSFSEFYALDFNDNIVLLGHDGPAHFKISNHKVGLVPLPVYHGKPGKGLSIQMQVKYGPVTLLSVCENSKGNVSFLVAEGESVEGETLHIGNTNSRYKFSLSAKDFINKWSLAGPSHHCAIGTGHIASTLHKIAKLYKIECQQIC